MVISLRPVCDQFSADAESLSSLLQHLALHTSHSNLVIIVIIIKLRSWRDAFLHITEASKPTSLFSSCVITAHSTLSHTESVRRRRRRRRRTPAEVAAAHHYLIQPISSGGEKADVAFCASAGDFLMMIVWFWKSSSDGRVGRKSQLLKLPRLN